MNDLSMQPAKDANMANPGPWSRAALLRLQSTVVDEAVVKRDNGIHVGGRAIYTDPELFELEIKHIFEAGWVYVAHESQLPKPHDFFSTTVGRKPVLLSRGRDGVICGFFNVCSHRGARVCRETSGNRKSHTCRFHGWTFNSSGELVGVTSEKEGGYPESFDRKELGLTPVPRVESYRGFIFASLSADVEDLPTHLGEAAKIIDLLVDQSPSGELEVIPGETTYTYAGNWKLAAENGVDGYHVPTTHANYVMTTRRRAEESERNPTKNLDVSNWGDGDSGFFAFAQGHALLYGPYFNFTDRPNYPGYDSYVEMHGAEKADWMVKKFRNLLLMPNLLLMDQMSSQIRVIRPLSVDLTETVTYCIAPKNEAPELRQKRIRQFEDFFNASGMATPDDLTEFHNCQLGYQASDAKWNELSRGATRWANGANDAANRLSITPLMSSANVADEGIYVAILGQWQARMTRAIATELQEVKA